MNTTPTQIFFIATLSITMSACSSYPANNKANSTGSYTGKSTNSAGYNNTSNQTKPNHQPSYSGTSYPEDNTSGMTYSNNQHTAPNEPIAYSSGENTQTAQTSVSYSNEGNNTPQTNNNNVTYSDSHTQPTPQVTYASSGNMHTTYTDKPNNTVQIHTANQPNQRGFVIQLIASINPQKANGIKDTFTAEGYQVIQNTINSNGQRLHRVQVGPYPTKRAAKAIFHKMKRRYKRNTYVNAAFINENK